MTDSGDDDLVRTVALMEELSLNYLLDFSHNPDAEQTLHQLGYAAQFLSDGNEVPEERKQELLARIKICHSAFEMKDFGKFTQQLFEFSVLFDRYILEARRKIESQEKQEIERAPFLFYAVNRAVILWANDSNHDLSLPHLSGLIAIELSKILEAVCDLLENNPEFFQNNENLQYMNSYKVAKTTIRDWLEKENEVVQIPDYARVTNSPQKKFRESWDQKRRIAESHDYKVIAGSGKFFGSQIPVDLSPPTYI